MQSRSNAALHPYAGDVAVVEEREARPAEAPLRIAQLRLLVGELGVLSVEVPPAAAVRHVVEHPIRAPLRLPDRLGRAAGHEARLLRSVKRRDPELGAVPRHVRVVPAGPGQLRAVRTEPGERVEVAPRREHARLALAVGRQRDQLVGRLAGAVGLAHAHDQPPVRAHAAVGVAHRAGLRRLGRDRARRLARIEAVEPLVGEVREEGGVLVEEPGTAAVLVHSRAHVDLRRGHVLRRREPASCARRPSACARATRPSRPRQATVPSAGCPSPPPWPRTGANATSHRGRPACRAIIGRLSVLRATLGLWKSAGQWTRSSPPRTSTVATGRGTPRSTRSRA